MRGHNFFQKIWLLYGIKIDTDVCECSHLNFDTSFSSHKFTTIDTDL